MELTTVLALVLGNGALIIPLFLWNRAESRTDIRHMDAKLDSNRTECLTMIRAIQEEMKDFHERLYKLELARNDK